MSILADVSILCMLYVYVCVCMFVFTGGHDVDFSAGNGKFYSSFGQIASNGHSDDEGDNLAINHIFCVNDRSAAGRQWNNDVFAHIRR